MNEKIKLGSPAGAELNTNVYNTRTVLKNVTVEIWDNPELAEASVGWYRQPDTEEVKE